MLIAGIDPGTNGAIAVLDSESPDSVALLDLKNKNIIDICNWLNECKFWGLDQASYEQIPTEYNHLSCEWSSRILIQIWLEDVHSMHGMSAKSNFGFGKNLGIVTAIAEIASDTVSTVTPKIWQKYIGVTAKGKTIKKEVAKIAQGFYPNVELHGKRGGLLDGRADALMIAHYGLKHWEEE